MRRKRRSTVCLLDSFRYVIVSNEWIHSNPTLSLITLFLKTSFKLNNMRLLVVIGGHGEKGACTVRLWLAVCRCIAGRITRRRHWSASGLGYTKRESSERMREDEEDMGRVKRPGLNHLKWKLGIKNTWKRVASVILWILWRNKWRTRNLYATLWILW